MPNIFNSTKYDKSPANIINVRIQFLIVKHSPIQTIFNPLKNFSFTLRVQLRQSLLKKTNNTATSPASLHRAPWQETQYPGSFSASGMSRSIYYKSSSPVPLFFLPPFMLPTCIVLRIINHWEQLKLGNSRIWDFLEITERGWGLGASSLCELM